jgi:2-hydroxychromene-2-carboxylate isomerase
MSAKLEFWLTLGSTYTYLTVQRIEQTVSEAGLELEILPFNLGLIFRKANFFPFNEGTDKTAYMWRDIERIAASRGLEPNLPAPYPSPETLRANKVALVTVQQGLGLAWIRQSYEAWFGKGLLPGTDDNLSNSLPAVGLGVDMTIAQAESPEAAAALQEQTELAESYGIFGAPAFRAMDELFWGDDRLEQAINWVRTGHI